MKWKDSPYAWIAAQYSETCIKQTPSITRTVAEVPKFISLIYFKWNLY